MLKNELIDILTQTLGFVQEPTLIEIDPSNISWYEVWTLHIKDEEDGFPLANEKQHYFYVKDEGLLTEEAFFMNDEIQNVLTQKKYADIVSDNIKTKQIKDLSKSAATIELQSKYSTVGPLCADSENGIKYKDFKIYYTNTLQVATSKISSLPIAKRINVKCIITGEGTENETTYFFTAS